MASRQPVALSRVRHGNDVNAQVHPVGTGMIAKAAVGPEITPMLAAFSWRYPRVRFTLAFGNSEEVLDDLLRRRCDVAVLPDIAPDERVFAVPLRRDRLVAFVEPGHPWAARRSIRLAELAAQRLILRELGSTTRAVFERALADAAVTLSATIEIGSREAVREAVAAGLGVGIVFESEFGCDERLHRLALRDVSLEAVEYAACLEERRALRAVRAFFDLLGGPAAGV